MLTLSEYRSTDKNMIMADVQMLANNLMFEHGLLDKGWFFNFDRAKNRFGLCSHRNKIISMSKYLTPARTFAQNKNTILHEIAHSIVGAGHGHDAVWEEKALSIGCDGARCGTMDADAERPEYRWYGVCYGCDGRVGLHRAPNRVRACARCSKTGVFDFDAVLYWQEFGDTKHISDMPERYQNEWYQLREKYVSH